MTGKEDPVEFGEAGFDPTPGATGGSDPAPQPSSAPPTPGAQGGQPAPAAPTFQSVADLAKAWGKPFSLDDLRALGGNSKLYDQPSVDAFVQDRLGRQQRQAEGILAQLRDEYSNRLRELQNNGATGEAAKHDPELVAFKEEMEDVKLDRTLEKLYRKFGDFEANENDILTIAFQHHTSPEAAYKIWKYDNHLSKMDMKTLKEQIIAEYVKSKTMTAGRTPTPEGAGGSAPVAANAHDGSFDTADKRAKARINNREVT